MVHQPTHIHCVCMNLEGKFEHTSSAARLHLAMVTSCIVPWISRTTSATALVGLDSVNDSGVWRTVEILGDDLDRAFTG